MTLLLPDQDLSSWCAAEARDALSRLKRFLKEPSFPLREAINDCYRLVAVGAALLTREDRDTIISEAYFWIEAMQIDLLDVHGRGASRFASATSWAMLPFVLFAKSKLRLRFPHGAADVFTQLFDRHSNSYFGADLDVNPDVVMRLCWKLYGTIESSHALGAVACVDALLSELNSVAPPSEHNEFQVDYAAIERWNAPIDPKLLEGSKKGVGRPDPFDDSARIARLVERAEKMTGEEAPDHEIARIQMEIDHARNFRGGIDPSRLYPDDLPF
jgi:hypothetical protein